MMMRKFCAVIGFSLCSSLAFAGPFGEDLQRCMINSTTEEEKSELVKMLFFAFSAHPTLADLQVDNPELKMQTEQNVAKILQRLLTMQCAKQARIALANEGMQGFQQGFEALGKAAAFSLNRDPNVHKALGGFMQYVDLTKLQESLRPKDK
ncbi:hypothetical protein ABHF33_12215 [Chitinibacter sp. FCG-7]|uniref:Uncharacterized protein n=1 Tax=Chitinibacter mangrovi TaxID=3153927 RepID=A0AAU7F8E1_9NEIS